MSDLEVRKGKVNYFTISQKASLFYTVLNSFNLPL